MINCIIVDDEPLARRILEKYISQVHSLNLAGQCKNAAEAAAYLHEHKTDVMFLDIKMPELTGLELLKTLSNPPTVILTTAYAEYALEGYEYAVADYLLKPFSFERFLKAVNRIQSCNSIQQEINVGAPKNDFIFLREDKIENKVFYSDITFIEAYGNFVKVNTSKKVLLASEKISTLEKKLPENLFVRTHKSFIIAVQKIEQIEGNMISIAGREIPIGGFFKKRVSEIIKENKPS